VVAVANDIAVRLPATDERTDPELRGKPSPPSGGQLPISAERIKVVVKNGWVTLEGTVEWHYQRNIAEAAVGISGASKA